MIGCSSAAHRRGDVLVAADDRFEPRAILATLERHRVNYVVIGALARVLHGTDEVTGGVDVCPQRRDENLERLDAALRDLDAAPVTDDVRAGAAVIARETTPASSRSCRCPRGRAAAGTTCAGTPTVRRSATVSARRSRRSTTSCA